MNCENYSFMLASCCLLDQCHCDLYFVLGVTGYIAQTFVLRAVNVQDTLILGRILRSINIQFAHRWK